ncbi:18985_t:CDS:2, partial [Rhizophagus irregularis]
TPLNTIGTVKHSITGFATQMEKCFAINVIMFITVLAQAEYPILDIVLIASHVVPNVTKYNLLRKLAII